MANAIKDVKVSLGAGLECELLVRGHGLVADEPADKGGGDEGPTPGELFLASLGACTAMTLRMYADLKGIALERVDVEMEQAWVTPEEWDDWPEGDERKSLPRIIRRIRLTGDLEDAQVERLRYIARRCPVHRTVTENPAVVDDIERG